VEPELGTVGDAKVLTTGSDVTVVGLAAGPDAIGVMIRTAKEIVSEAEYGLIRRTSKGTNFNSFGTATGVPGMAYCGDRFFLALPRSAAPKVQLFELLAAETVPSDMKLKFQAQFPHNVTLACRKKDVLVAWEESSLANAPVDAIVAQRPFAPTPNTTVLTKAGGAPSAPSATVVGNGFGTSSANSSVEIGSAACFVSNWTATKIICTVGSAVAGTHSVLVFTTIYGLAKPSTASANQVTVALVLNTAAPLSVGMHGGATITLQGAGFASPSTSTRSTQPSISVRKSCAFKFISFSISFCVARQPSTKQGPHLILYKQADRYRASMTSGVMYCQHCPAPENRYSNIEGYAAQQGGYYVRV
jgi:hypothetical protein